MAFETLRQVLGNRISQDRQFKLGEQAADAESERAIDRLRRSLMEQERSPQGKRLAEEQTLKIESLKRQAEEADILKSGFTDFNTKLQSGAFTDADLSPDLLKRANEVRNNEKLSAEERQVELRDVFFEQYGRNNPDFFSAGVRDPQLKELFVGGLGGKDTGETAFQKELDARIEFLNKQTEAQSKLYKQRFEEEKELIEQRNEGKAALEKAKHVNRLWANLQKQRLLALRDALNRDFANRNERMRALTKGKDAWKDMHKNLISGLDDGGWWADVLGMLGQEPSEVQKQASKVKQQLNDALKSGNIGKYIDLLDEFNISDYLDQFDAEANSKFGIEGVDANTGGNEEPPPPPVDTTANNLFIETDEGGSSSPDGPIAQATKALPGLSVSNGKLMHNGKVLKTGSGRELTEEALRKNIDLYGIDAVIASIKNTNGIK